MLWTQLKVAQEKAPKRHKILSNERKCPMSKSVRVVDIVSLHNHDDIKNETEILKSLQF